MTDHRDGLAGGVDAAHKFLRLGLHPQMIGIESAAGQQHRVEIFGIGFVESEVHCDLLAFFIVLHALDLA